MWVRVGVGITNRNILHTIADHYGNIFCELVAFHYFTGADYTNKIGRKVSALQAHPDQYLSSFRHSNFEHFIYIYI